jgi:hypothetical protein
MAPADDGRESHRWGVHREAFIDYDTLAGLASERATSTGPRPFRGGRACAALRPAGGSKVTGEEPDPCLLGPDPAIPPPGPVARRPGVL